MSSAGAWAIVVIVLADAACNVLSSYYSPSKDECVKCTCKYAEESLCEWNDETNCYCVHGCYRDGVHGNLLSIRECFPLLNDYD
ncbi:hypothetical protein MRX96_023464 [Rhipicephalus microplus]